MFREAFDWIRENAATAELGFHQLDESKCVVRIMEYALRSREEANYEHHRHTVDLQVTLQGTEGIEWSPLEGMKTKGDYLAEKDFQFLETCDSGAAFVSNREGQFCILFPEDAHQPQRATEGFDFVRKLVVKIPVSLVSEG